MHIAIYQIIKIMFVDKHTQLNYNETLLYEAILLLACHSLYSINVYFKTTQQCNMYYIILVDNFD